MGHLDLIFVSCIFTACMDGYYGEFCNNTCSVSCKSGCYIFDGTCIDGCVGNYHGDKCDSTCSQNCQLGCISGSTCIGGQCNSGFTGSECTTGTAKKNNKRNKFK